MNIMELSNIMKGTIFIIVLSNMVAVNKSHSGVYRRRNPVVPNVSNQNYFSNPSCVPCGSNYECIRRLNNCDGVCDCISCEDELYCGDLTKRNTRLFDARCDVQLIRTTSTQTKTETSKATQTSTVTSVTTKVGTAILSSTFREVAAARFTHLSQSISILNGAVIPDNSTACFLVVSNVTVTDNLTFRLEQVTSTQMSLLTFTRTCTATTIFQGHR
ncbi:hypothetical protein ACF0H5_000577 [Mactra antiquata]